MISSKRKLYITIAVFGCIFAALIICAAIPLFKRVRAHSQNLARQKVTLNLFQAQLSSLSDFQKKYSLYQDYLEKIASSFVDPAAPISFMEFLEAQAGRANLLINISAISPSLTPSGPWLSTELTVSLGGTIENCLRFLEELQHSPWLVEVSRLDIRKSSEGDFGRIKSEKMRAGDFSCSVSLKVFSEKDSID